MYKILYIHHEGHIAGSAISLRNFLSALDRSMFEPHLVLGSDGPARKLYEDLDIPVTVVPMDLHYTFPGPRYLERGFIKNFKALLPNKRLQEYIRYIEPAVIHINDKALLSAGICAKSLHIPVVWHLRSSYYATHARLHAIISREVIKRCATEMIAISEDELDGFEQISNVHLVYNTVDLDSAQAAIDNRTKTRHELGFTQNDLVIGLIGALNERKGAWDFLQAAGLVRKQNPNTNLRFVILAAIPLRGPRPQGIREHLRLASYIHPLDKTIELATKADISDVLTLTGFREDPLNVMAAFDIAVVANRLGVLGRPPFEAMSVGCPLIVTAGHSKRSKVVEPGKTAIVVPPADVKALADAISECCRSLGARISMQLAGIDYARQNFDPRKNMAKIEGIYRKILKID